MTSEGGENFCVDTDVEDRRELPGRQVYRVALSLGGVLTSRNVWPWWSMQPCCPQWIDRTPIVAAIHGSVMTRLLRTHLKGFIQYSSHVRACSFPGR
jgi:hypothetical protein